VHGVAQLASIPVDTEVLQITLAGVLGLFLGLEREWSHKSAGVRTFSLIGILGAGTTYLRDELVPDLIDEQIGWLPAGARDRLADFATSWLLERAVFEAYIIQNPESAAAREAAVTAGDVLTPQEAAQRAAAAERHLGSEVIYVEYSGTFGDEEAVELLEAVESAVSWSRVWYGGGLDSRAASTAVLDAGADAVIVGNGFHAIAEEEMTLCERATDALAPDADATAVRDWVAESVDLDEASATAYLATVPGVDDPVELAGNYAAATVDAWLGLDRLRESPGDRADHQHFVDERAEAELSGGTAVDTLARAYATASLADERDGEPGQLPLAHIGVLADD
jgi:phosphoglycerol geranylgeranyltransferase